MIETFLGVEIVDTLHVEVFGSSREEVMEEAPRTPPKCGEVVAGEVAGQR